MRFKLSMKEGILPLAAGLLLLAVASYFLLFAPELRTIAALKAEIAAREAEVGEALKLRAVAAESRAGEGAKWEQRLRSWEERVPSSPGTDRLLTEVGEHAVRHNLKAFGLAPAPADPGAQGASPPEAGAGGTPPNAKGKMVESRYRITFRSTYRDMAEFVDGLPRMRRLLTVRSVSIKEKSDAMVTTVDFSAWHRGAR